MTDDCEEELLQDGGAPLGGPPFQRRLALVVAGAAALAKTGLGTVPASAAARISMRRRVGGGGDPLWSAEWDVWRSRFLAPDGRVIDTGNGGVSHSEGQSYGLLLAEASGDRDAFENIFAWSRRELHRPADALLAWRWRSDQDPRVDDLNNATDGDLIFAWALARAFARWRVPAHRDLARAIARDVLRLLVLDVGHRTLLMAAVHGFRSTGTIVVNPSYYVFEAMDDLSTVLPDPAWQRIRDDGIQLLRDGRFGPFGLPPDWLAVPPGTGALAPAADWPARFSWDATRVPLHLIWAGLGEEPAVSAASRFWASQTPPPAWADLVTGTSAPEAASVGQRAIAMLAAKAARRGDPAIGDLPRVAEAQDYYAGSLTLLARLAVQEAFDG